jgi:hypothetical protein
MALVRCSECGDHAARQPLAVLGRVVRRVGMSKAGGRRYAGAMELEAVTQG